MSIDAGSLPRVPTLLRVRTSSGDARLVLWRDGAAHDLSAAEDTRLHTLDRLLSISRHEIVHALEEGNVGDLPQLDPEHLDWLSPVESQEVWAAGVTYLRSRDARLEESSAKSAYELVYVAERPE